MAININIQPSTWIIAGNKVRYRVGGSLYLDGGIVRPDYKITCKLFRIDVIGGSPISAVLIGTFYGIPSVSKSFIASSTTFYYVDFELSDAIMADLQENAIPTAHTRTTPNSFRIYKCDFNESYDNSLVSLTISNSCAAIAAGQPELRNYDASSFITRYLTAATEQRFLNTYRPKGRILWDKLLILNYYNSYSSGNLNLKAKAYYHHLTDKTVAEFFIFPLTNPGVNFVHWAINLSSVSWATSIGDPFFAGLTNTFNPEGIYKIEFYVTNPSDRKSEILAFDVVHPRMVREAKAFYFKNSAGFWECMVTTGKAIEKDKLTSLDADLLVDNSNAGTTKVAYGNLKKYNHKLGKEVKQACGFTDKTQFEQFRDFLRSDAKFVAVGNYLYSIIVTDTDFDGLFDDQKLFGRTFTYMLASEEGFFE
jgi:hypothetical protein